MKKFLLAMIILLAFSAPLFAQERAINKLYYLNEQGDIISSDSPSQGRIHILGQFTLDSADYFRGRFDGVESDLDEWAFHPNIAMVIELWRGPETQPLQHFNLVLGSQNGISGEEPVEAEHPKWWYESNNFIGFTLESKDEWRVAGEYTIYTSPNNTKSAYSSSSRHEIDATIQYTGRSRLGSLRPQVKMAIPVENGDGFYTEVSIDPKFLMKNTDLSLDVPVVVGMGVADYYGHGTDEAVYGQIGLKGSYPIQKIAADYGTWSLEAGLFLIWREDDIVDVGRPFGDSGNTVLYGSVGVSFAY